MTVFEKVTASPEALGELLDSLTVIESPWEAEFHKVFCAGCGQTDCGACPHEKERNNPTWWLAQVVEGEQTASRVVWRNGRVELEPEMIVPLEEPTANGICNEFNVYLNGKGSAETLRAFSISAACVRRSPTFLRGVLVDGAGRRHWRGCGGYAEAEREARHRQG